MEAVDANEHVYCVTVTFKMTEQVEQWIWVQFCVKLEHSSVEAIQMIQKATAMSNWWLAALSQQHAHSCITSLVQSFLVKHQVTRGLSPPTAQIWLLAFPKTKITFEREEISDYQWDLGKYDGAADGEWENCVRTQGAYFEGDWGIIVLCTMFLVSCIFFNKCLYFYIIWLDTFWTDLMLDSMSHI